MRGTRKEHWAIWVGLKLMFEGREPGNRARGGAEGGLYRAGAIELARLARSGRVGSSSRVPVWCVEEWRRFRSPEVEGGGDGTS